MRVSRRLLGLNLAISMLIACRSTPVASPPAGTAPRQTAAPTDSIAARRRQLALEVTRQIGERGSQPASQVFHNLQSDLLRNAPASRVLAIMDQGYGRSLGVSCEFCHVPGRYESDSLPTKRIARQMQAMVLAINGDLLHKTGVRPEAVVNCTTCHQGSSRPITNLSQRSPGG